MDTVVITLLLLCKTALLLSSVNGKGLTTPLSGGTDCPDNWWYLSTGQCLYIADTTEDHATAGQQCQDCRADLLTTDAFETVHPCITNLGLSESYWLKNSFSSGTMAVWDAGLNRYKKNHPQIKNKFLCLLQKGDLKLSSLSDIQNNSQCPLVLSNSEQPLHSTMPEEAHALICAPHCPTNLRVTDEEADYITLAWHAGWETGTRQWFRVSSTNENDIRETIFDNVRGTAVNITGLKADKTYTFKVEPYYGALFKDRCNDNTLQFATGPPDCPTYVRVTNRGADYITLSWQPGMSRGSIQSFQVYYTTNIVKAAWNKYGDMVEETSLEVGGLMANTAYYLRVVSSSMFSPDNINADTCGYTLHHSTAAPDCPTDIRVTSNGLDHITLAWQQPSSEESNGMYTIFLTTDMESSTWDEFGEVVKQTSVKVDGLKENTVYNFRVVSLNKFRDPSNINEETCSNTIRSRTVRATPTLTCPQAIEGKAKPTLLTCEMKTSSPLKFTSVTFGKTNSSTDTATCYGFTCDSSEGYKASVETISGEITATLNIEEVTRADAGRWECSFLFGDDDRRTSQCEMEVVGPPDCPTNIRVTNQSADHIVLSWQPGTPRASVQLFHVYFSTDTEMTTWQLYVGGLKGTSVDISGLRESTGYNFRVVSSNIHSSATDINEDTCNSTTGFKTAQALNGGFDIPLIPLLVAGIFGLLIILVVLILIVHRKRRMTGGNNKSEWNPENNDVVYAAIRNNENHYNGIDDIPHSEVQHQSTEEFMTNGGYSVNGFDRKLLHVMALAKNEYITPLDYGPYTTIDELPITKDVDLVKDADASSLPLKIIDCSEDGYLLPLDIHARSDRDGIPQGLHKEVMNLVKDGDISPISVESSKTNSCPAPLKDVDTDVTNSNTDLKNVVELTDNENSLNSSLVALTGNDNNGTFGFDENDSTHLKGILNSVKNDYTRFKEIFGLRKNDNTEVKDILAFAGIGNIQLQSVLKFSENGGTRMKDVMTDGKKTLLKREMDFVEADDTVCKRVEETADNNITKLKTVESLAEDDNTQPKHTTGSRTDDTTQLNNMVDVAKDDDKCHLQEKMQSPEYGFFCPGDIDFMHDHPCVKCFSQLKGLADLREDDCKEPKRNPDQAAKDIDHIKPPQKVYSKPLSEVKLPSPGKYAKRKLPAPGLFG